jgi:hypothetical protein
MIDDQEKILDPHKRGASIQEIYKKLLEDAPITTLVSVDRFWLFQPWVFPKEVYTRLSKLSLRRNLDGEKVE